jgi:uncharacterized membrane protein
MQAGETARGARIAAIDAGRGIALAGMALYHLSWDCAYFGLAPSDLPALAPMRLFSNLVAGAFLATAGVSLALAHRDGLRSPAFWRRIGKIGGAAALVTAASYVFARQETIYFGILHCILVASLISAWLIGVPAWISLAIGALALLAPALVVSPAFDAPALVWLGLGTVPPHTLDWRPLTPWSGLVFLGLGAARLDLRRFAAGRLAAWTPRSAGGRALTFAGRHSLAIYLVHQPVLLGLLFAGTSLTGFEARREAKEFSHVCQRECVGGGGAPDVCRRACGCVLHGLLDAGLARAVARDTLDDAQTDRYTRIVQSCSAPPPGAH